VVFNGKVPVLRAFALGRKPFITFMEPDLLLVHSTLRVMVGTQLPVTPKVAVTVPQSLVPLAVPEVLVTLVNLW